MKVQSLNHWPARNPLKCIVFGGGGAALGLVAVTVAAASTSAVEVHRLLVVVAFLVEHKMIIHWQTVHLLFDCFLSSL